MNSPFSGQAERPAVTSTGVYCLANDGIIDGLIALCASLRTNCPDLPLSVIPFDSQLTKTRQVLSDYGFSLVENATLRKMDELGERYWPGQPARAHTMRKFCAFWSGYDRFVFLDADVVVLADLRIYLEALGEYDFMYFATDIENVYRPGPIRDEIVATYGTAGFNSGVFVSRSGLLDPESVESARVLSVRHRAGFVDNLEQSFLNYVVDTRRWSKISAHDAVPDWVDVGALMRLKKAAEGLVLDDARVPQSGRRVSLIHWAGYSIGPFMPYRGVFARYRLSEHSVLDRVRYDASDIRRMLRRASLRSAVRSARTIRREIRNSLAARGLIRWP